MKSFFQTVIESIQTDINKGFELVAYDRQLLVFIILSLMLDQGIYDYEISNESMDGLLNHGIMYSFNEDNTKLVVRAIFPEEANKLQREESE